MGLVSLDCWLFEWLLVGMAHTRRLAKVSGPMSHGTRILCAESILSLKMSLYSFWPIVLDPHNLLKSGFSQSPCPVSAFRSYGLCALDKHVFCAHAQGLEGLEHMFTKSRNYFICIHSHSPACKLCLRPMRNRTSVPVGWLAFISQWCGRWRDPDPVT